jgi:hypothetical protein
MHLWSHHQHYPVHLPLPHRFDRIFHHHQSHPFYPHLLHLTLLLLLPWQLPRKMMNYFHRHPDPLHPLHPLHHHPRQSYAFRMIFVYSFDTLDHPHHPHHPIAHLHLLLPLQLDNPSDHLLKQLKYHPL